MNWRARPSRAPIGRASATRSPFGLALLKGTLEAYTDFRRLEQARSLRSQAGLADSYKPLLANLESDKDLQP